MRILVWVLSFLFLLLLFGRWAGGLVLSVDDEAAFALDIALAVVGLVFATSVIVLLLTTSDKASSAT